MIGLTEEGREFAEKNCRELLVAGSSRKHKDVLEKEDAR